MNCTPKIIHAVDVEVAAGRAGAARAAFGVCQFDSGSAIVSLTSGAMKASLHAEHTDLRAFAVALIDAADAFDAQQVSA